MQTLINDTMQEQILAGARRYVFTERQLALLLALLDGHTGTSDLTRQLDVSAATVGRELEAMLRATGARDRGALAVFLLREGRELQRQRNREQAWAAETEAGAYHARWSDLA